jgi:hypothetical protein
MPLTIVKQTFGELQQNSDLRPAINFGRQTINGGNTFYENIFNSKFSFFLLFGLVTHTPSVADVNRILLRNDLNSFRVEFRLVHGEKRVIYPSDPIWQRKFTECT